MSNYTHQPDSKTLAFSIISLKSVFKKHLIGKAKPYEPLLRAFLKYDYYDDDIGLPDSGKAVYAKVGIKSATYRKWLEDIHRDLMEVLWEASCALSYPKYHCFLVIRGLMKTKAEISMELAHVPKVGENIELPFMKATLLTESFFVNEVYHRFTDTGHKIVLFLKPGHFNGYQKMENDKEYIVDRYKWRHREENQF